MEIIAAIALGFGVAGLVMLLRHLSGGSIPRVAMPVAAGVAMLGFGTWSEYSWFDRQARALPNGIYVVSSVRESSAWRPWTWAWPYVTRFAAVNAAGARRNEALPGQVLADVYFIGRHVPAAKLTQIVDCPGERRADVMGKARFDEIGQPKDAHWIPLRGDDPLHRALCDGERAATRDSSRPNTSLR